MIARLPWLLITAGRRQPLLAGGLSPRACAPQGLAGIHGPSTVVKSGHTYGAFGTGPGTYGLSPIDLVNWTPGPPGLHLVQVRRAGGVLTQKLTVL